MNNLIDQINEEKLSWEDTYKEMAQEHENWQDFENTSLDGLEINEVPPQGV